jgi:DNA-binding response OmpR family regulator
MLNGDAHFTPLVGLSYAFDRCHIFSKTGTPARITQMPLTILHVEDNPLVAAAVNDLLTAAGWQVTLFMDGLTALQEIERQTHYDLLLLDNELPHLDGWQLITHARTLAHRQHTPIILTSARDRTTLAQQIGADAFLPKPEGINHLLATITRLIHQAA